MALVIKDRVKETTTTTGTGTYTLAGAVSGFETFTANLSNSDTTYYVCTDNTDFEVGLGTFTSSGTTLARTTVLASSNSNNAVNWSSGTRSIFMTYPADKAVFKDANNNVALTALTVDGSNISLDSTSTLNIDNSNAGNGILIGTNSSGVPVSIGHTTSETIINDNLSVTGDLIANGNITPNASDGSSLGSADREFSDLFLADGAVIKLGDDQDVTLTHVADTGLKLNSTRQLQFGDSGTYIHQSADGVLDLVSDTEIEINATTVDINGDADISGDITVGDDLTVNGGLIDLKTNSGSVAQLKFYCESGNAHAQTLQAQPHSASASDVLTLPTGGNSTLVSRLSTDTLTNKTLTSPVLNTGVSGTAIKDEDDMNSDSATHLATQQSIKAYVDANSGMSNFILEDGDGTEVTVADGKEVKFVEGGGLDINWTDTSTGSDGDPYDLTFTVNAAQTDITSVVNTSLEIGRDADNRIKFGTDNQIIFEVSGGDNVIFKASGEIEATSLDIGSGGADIDGTLEANAITVGGTALNTVIAGVTVTNATTAAVATTVTITDNESTNEDNAIIFTAGGDVDGGNIGLESDGTLTYNPSTGKITATGFIGALTGNADTASAVAADNISTGDAAVTIATSSGNITLDAQGSDTDIKFKGTDGSSDITALTLDMSNGGTAVFSNNINLSSDSSILKFGVDNEITLTHVHNTGLKLNSTSQLQFGDSGTYIHQSADGVLDLVSDTEIEINATTIDMNGNLDVSGTITSGGVITGTGFTIGSAVIAEAELEQLDGITAGTVAASKAVVVDANKDVASFRNVTLTGELDAATGDFSGDVDIDGTLEADAITVNGTALNTVIADEATALAIALG